MSTLTSNRRASQSDYKAFYCRILVAMESAANFCFNSIFEFCNMG